MKKLKFLKNLLFALLIISFALIACEKEELVETVTERTSNLSGFGNRDGTPSGTPFYLPNNVGIITEIESSMQDDSLYQTYGIGGLYVCFTLKNYTSNMATVEFPAGLILLPDNDTTQKVLTIYPVKIRLPSKGSIKMKLGGYCMNKDKGFQDGIPFTMGVVSNNDQVTTLVNNLSNKSESTLIPHRFFLQEIVWNITDRDGLSQADLDTINSW